MEKSTDKELMKCVQERDTSALKVLYQRYEMAIFNFILRFTGSREIARDLIQETFTRAWLAAHTFDHKRGNFKGWLYTIALNLARNEMSKKEYTYQFLPTDEGSDYRDGLKKQENPTPETTLEQRELKESVAAALGELKPHLREVVVMKHWQQLTFKEIAAVTAVPESTLKARYHRAVSELKQYLGAREVSKDV